MALDERKKELLNSDLFRDVCAKAAENTKEDWDVSAKVIAAVLEVLLNSNEGPCTILIPTVEAVEELFRDKDDDAPSTPESFKAQVGLLLDSILRGTLLADGFEEAIAASNGAVQFSTLTGSAVTATLEQGKVVLTDPFGNRVTATGPQHRGPRGDVFYKADGFLMGELWIDYFEPRPSGEGPSGTP
ncbi:MAG TPA: hypothetical protein VF067_00010 [Sphingomicrobium sp.]